MNIKNTYLAKTTNEHAQYEDGDSIRAELLAFVVRVVQNYCDCSRCDGTGKIPQTDDACDYCGGVGREIAIYEALEIEQAALALLAKAMPGPRQGESSHANN